MTAVVIVVIAILVERYPGTNIINKEYLGVVVYTHP